MVRGNRAVPRINPRTSAGCDRPFHVHPAWKPPCVSMLPESRAIVFNLALNSSILALCASFRRDQDEYSLERVVVNRFVSFGFLDFIAPLLRTYDPYLGKSLLKFLTCGTYVHRSDIRQKLSNGQCGSFRKLKASRKIVYIMTKSASRGLVHPTCISTLIAWHHLSQGQFSKCI